MNEIKTVPAPPVCEGEPCEKVYNAKCVAYTGSTLEGLGIADGDSLETILLKLKEAVSKAVDIEIEDTNSIELTGNGSSTNPLKADVRISNVEDNFLTAENDGLSVVITEQFVSRLLDLISASPSLQAALKSIYTPATTTTTAGPLLEN